MRRLGAALTVACLLLAATALQAQPPPLPAVDVRTYLVDDPAGPLGYLGFNHLARQVQCTNYACRYTTFLFPAGLYDQSACPDPWAVHGYPGTPLAPVDPKARFLYQYDEDGAGPALPALYTRPFHPGPDPTGGVEDQVRFVADGLRPTNPWTATTTQVRVRIVAPGVRKSGALAVFGAAGVTFFTGTVDSAVPAWFQDDALQAFAQGYWNGGTATIVSGTGAGQTRTVQDFVSAQGRVFVNPNFTTTPDTTSVYELRLPAPQYQQYFSVPPGLTPMVSSIDLDGNGYPDHPILANPATAREQLWTIEFYSASDVRTAPTAQPRNNGGGTYFALWRGQPPGAPPPPRPTTNLDSPIILPTIDDARGGLAVNSHDLAGAGEPYEGLWVSNSEEIAFAFSDMIDQPGQGLAASRIQFRTYSNATYYPELPAVDSGDNPSVSLSLPPPPQPGVELGSIPGTVRLTDAFLTAPHVLEAGQTGVGRVEVQELVPLSDGRSVWRPYDVDPGLDPNGFANDHDLLVDPTARTHKGLFAQFMSSRQRVDPAVSPPAEAGLPPEVGTPLVDVGLAGPGTQTAPAALAVGNWVMEQTLQCPTCGAHHAITDAYTHSAADSVCEYDGTPLAHATNLERPGSDLGFAEYGAMTSPVGQFSRATLAPTAPVRMPFETVLFAPLTASLPMATVPGGANAGVSIKVPKYQRPSGPGAPYRGVALAIERRDEHQRWYRGPTGFHFNYTGVSGDPVPDGARPGDVLYDDNGRWDAYYQCPDCGNKQDVGGACLNPRCPGHWVCPIHLSLLPAGLPACPFYFGDIDGPAAIPAINPGGPPGMIGAADVSAEEYDPFLLSASVAPAANGGVGPQTVSVGKVQPGAAAPVTPEDPAGADIFPKERARPAEVPVRNEGNVLLAGVGMAVAPLVRTEVNDAASSLERVQQSSSVNPPGTEFVNYADGATAGVGFGVMPPYADDEAGSPYTFLPGGAPGPMKLRAGTTVAPIMPVGSGTPAGEYAGSLSLLGSTVAVRARIVESRAPDTMNGLVSSEAGPSPYFEPTGALSLAFSSNTPGGPADTSHGIYAATVAPLVAGTPTDAFYRAHDLAAAAVGAVSPAAAGPNVVHARPYAFRDNPWAPTTAWVYWHTRQQNPGTGLWNSFLGVYSPALGGPGTPLFDSRQMKGGVAALIPQEPANAALHWLFWHAGEEGHQQVGFSPRMDPTAPATMDDYWLHLTNARMGTADPQFITYQDYSSAPAVAPNVTPGSVIRKPDSNPFVFTKDPWVFEYPDNRPLPAFADEDHLINVFYAAQVRRQNNSDICWSMFDAYAGAATVPLMTVPAENYGKRAFPRQFGEVLRADGQYQVFEARHLDWVISAGFPNTSAPFDPVLTVEGIGVAWSAGNTGANYYDPKTGLIKLQPTNLPPDPITGAPLRIEIDPSGGVVAFSRSLATVFGGPVTVTLDYQPFTFRITTDGNNDDSPAAFTDLFGRLAVFWRRSHSVSEAPHIGATSIIYKGFSTSVQVLQPPIVGGAVATIPPTVVNDANGVLWWDPSTIATLPFSVDITYNGITETHQVVGWSKEVVVPLDTVAAEGPIDVTQEIYDLDGTPGGPSGVKYWLFWTSNRGHYAPSVGSLAASGRSDIYYTTVCPTFGTDVPE
ncbi:MAG: hypothetical protein ACE5R4_11085 [Armatimonadota bacterium]